MSELSPINNTNKTETSDKLENGYNTDVVDAIERRRRVYIENGNVLQNGRSCFSFTFIRDYISGILNFVTSFMQTMIPGEASEQYIGQKRNNVRGINETSYVINDNKTLKHRQSQPKKKMGGFGPNDSKFKRNCNIPSGG